MHTLRRGAVHRQERPGILQIRAGSLGMAEIRFACRFCGSRHACLPAAVRCERACRAELGQFETARHLPEVCILHNIFCDVDILRCANCLCRTPWGAGAHISASRPRDGNFRISICGQDKTNLKRLITAIRLLNAIARRLAPLLSGTEFSLK